MDTKPAEPENTDGPEKKAKVAKYSESAGSMIANLKYGSGMPWHRVEKLQGNLSVPLPASTQWDVVEKVADRIHPVFTALEKEGAQGDVIHNDDTIMKNLELMKAQAEQLEQEQGKPGRSGMFTTSILSIKDGRKIALFYSSANHAGENLENLLEQRDKDRGPPIQMCDALSRNAPETFQTLLANCLSHGRRKFVEVNWAFPEECRYVLEIFNQQQEIPFGPPPDYYSYRCSQCLHEYTVNEVIVDAAVDWSRWDGDYREGSMPILGCPNCNQETLEYVNDLKPA